MHDARCRMHDEGCNTLVDLIFVRTVNIPNLSLLPCFKVAYDTWCMMHDVTPSWSYIYENSQHTESQPTTLLRSGLIFFLTHETDWRTKQCIEAACCLKMQEFMRTVKTVNDCAERGVRMIKEYSKILKKDAGTRNWLLQGVELNRKKYPDFNIKTLNM